jgi:hypothetical protein
VRSEYEMLRNQSNKNTPDPYTEKPQNIAERMKVYTYILYISYSWIKRLSIVTWQFSQIYA